MARRIPSRPWKKDSLLMFGAFATIALYVSIQTLRALVQAGFIKIVATLFGISIGLSCVIHSAHVASYFYFRFRSSVRHARESEINASQRHAEVKLRHELNDDVSPSPQERYKIRLLQNNDHCSKEKLKALVEKSYALPLFSPN